MGRRSRPAPRIKRSHFWDVKSHRPLGEAIEARSAVADLAFGHRGLVALMSDGTVVAWNRRLWSIGGDTLDALRQRLCDRIGRVAEGEWSSALAGEDADQPC